VSGVSSPSGLVSVPTTDKRLPSPSESLRSALGAFVPDPDRSRIAKLRRAVGFSARAHLAERPGFRSDAVLMLTATYRDGAEWEPGHVRAWLKNVREWFKARGKVCRYVWVAELTKRGRVHYHVALWMPSGEFLPASDAAGWWPHGSTRTERARAAVPYLLKYLSKGGTAEAHKLPSGARMYGVGGLEFAMRRARRWLGLPGFVQSRSDIFDSWHRATGGGWCSPELVVIPSEFQRVWAGDSFALLRVADYGRPFNPSGPFTWVHRRPESKA